MRARRHHNARPTAEGRHRRLLPARPIEDGCYSVSFRGKATTSAPRRSRRSARARSPGRPCRRCAPRGHRAPWSRSRERCRRRKRGSPSLISSRRGGAGVSSNRSMPKRSPSCWSTNASSSGRHAFSPATHPKCLRRRSAIASSFSLTPVSSRSSSTKKDNEKTSWIKSLRAIRAKVPPGLLQPLQVAVAPS